MEFIMQFVCLFAKLPRPGDSKVTFAIFESSCHMLSPVYPLKGKDNLVNYLVNKVTTSELSGLSSRYRI